MMLFGKSAKNMEIMEADLLPDGKELYIVAADSDCNLHIMQFDPERKSEHPQTIKAHTNVLRQIPNLYKAISCCTARHLP